VTVTWMMLHLLVANMISKIKIGAGCYLHFIRFIVEGNWSFSVICFILEFVPHDFLR
jgi:hypothetical protein